MLIKRCINKIHPLLMSKIHRLLIYKILGVLINVNIIIYLRIFPFSSINIAFRSLKSEFPRDLKSDFDQYSHYGRFYAPPSFIHWNLSAKALPISFFLGVTIWAISASSVIRLVLASFHFGFHLNYGIGLESMREKLKL